MSFLLQRVSGRNLTLTQVSGSVLRIGRGTNQELRSENPAVALEHAVIESDAAGYLITDKGSITGTYVNRKPVETARLSKGDVIEVGNLRIEVQIADPAIRSSSASPASVPPWGRSSRKRSRPTRSPLPARAWCGPGKSTTRTRTACSGRG